MAWPTVIGVERPETEGLEEDEIVLSVPAMTCRDCARAVSRHVLDVAGVVTVQVDLKSRTIRDRGTPQLDVVLKAITDAGYEARAGVRAPTDLDRSPESREQAPRKWDR